MWVVDCPVCDATSDEVHRCTECGADLAERPDSALDQRRVQEGVVLETDLVDVRFPLKCLTCERRHDAAIDYCDVGLVLSRYPCPNCEAATPHRPVGEDLYRHHDEARDEPLDLPAPAPTARNDAVEADA